MNQLAGKTNDAPETASGAPPPVRPRTDGRSIPAADERRRVLHPRDLVCPRCGAGVDRPCSFSGHVQTEIHCTERLLALGDPDLRADGRPDPPPRNAGPASEPPRKRRPLPSRPVPPRASEAEADHQPPLTLFG